MQIGLLIIIVGFAFMIAIGGPAAWVTLLIMKKLGILPDKQTDYEKKYKYDQIYWSLFFYFMNFLGGLRSLNLDHFFF